MPLGWIDFSSQDRQIVREILASLSESTRDELGIAPIRDGFSDVFFPGTSTNQTRAKYFFIVSYLLMDLEDDEETNPNRLAEQLREWEKECALALLDDRNDDTEGVIGKRSLENREWIQRTPASIYWAGLRQYGIFTDASKGLWEYLGEMGKRKAVKNNRKRLGNRADNADLGESDDKDAGNGLYRSFWKLDTGLYHRGWRENLSIKLTRAEGAFLKRQITNSSFPAVSDSLLAHILRDTSLMRNVCCCPSFQEFGTLIQRFPKRHQENYQLALAFSDFLFVLRTIYNLIVSQDKDKRPQNQNAVLTWQILQPELLQRAAVNLGKIFQRLNVGANIKMCSFLYNAQRLMRERDLEGLKDIITRREIGLKGKKAKTLHPDKCDPNEWIGGTQLDYRFSVARTMIKDMATSEGLC